MLHNSGLMIILFVYRAMLNDKIRNDIKNKIIDIKNKVFNEQKLFPVIDSLRNVLKSSVENDKTDNINSLGEWEDNVANDKAFIKKRFDELLLQFNKYPRPFLMKRINQIITEPFKFEWDPSSDPAGKGVIYTLTIGKKVTLPYDAIIKYENIKDNYFYIDSLPEPGDYFWLVEATNESGTTRGYDTYNQFTIKNPSSLPCTISENLTLTKDKSPYYVDCEVNVPEGVSLTVEPEAVLLFLGDGKIISDGEFKVKGSKDKIVYFRSLNEGMNKIILNNSFNIDYAEFSGVEIALNKGKGFINNTNFNLNNNKPEKFISGSGSELNISNSFFNSFNQNHKALDLTSSKNVKINNSIFKEFDIAVEIKISDNVEVKNNQIKNNNSGVILTAVSNYSVSSNFISKSGTAVLLDSCVSGAEK